MERSETEQRLYAQIAATREDQEFIAAIRGLDNALDLGITEDGDPGGIHAIEVLTGAPGSERLIISAPAIVWENVMSACPPVGQHSLTAALRSGAVKITGEALHIAQSLHALERLFEILRGQRDEGVDEPSLQSISGHYAVLTMPDGERIQVFTEESGKRDGPVLLMLHTAGADARQYHALMANESLQSDWRLVAFDMPGHGRSMPRQGHAWRPHVLTKADYLGICQAFITQYLRRKIVILGCSMGAAMALKLAKEFPEEVLAAVALEAPWKAKGRRSPMLCHAQVNQVAHNAAYVRGLMSPISPLALRRRAAWIYGQGGFDIYGGDLIFYSDDFDAEADLVGLSGENRIITLLTGAYDYSASPTDSGKVSAVIPGSRLIVMQDLGHFPMVENPSRLLDYLLPELDLIRRMVSSNAH
ncbi:MAG: alpha/beta hydrolase [Castellaniella sp.]|uniref:alpha/beta fold hydrolase n=1 Tax=Castellaniella sp. TaxID=1955812 RepID=UPI00122798CD|nr:alpha/beta hydrolase [Castellaniella sp.]TAN29974.1 MAG: alpha/beta hydrolase [Castellaniella sp.]